MGPTTGVPAKHKGCAAILTFVAGGKKGREVRAHFAAPGCGWPQDAVDGALLVLVGSGHLHAVLDGKAVTQRQLDQTKIGVTAFRLESTTVTLPQRLALRKLSRQSGVRAASDDDVREWLAEVEAMVREQLGSGPVIVSSGDGKRTSEHAPTAEKAAYAVPHHHHAGGGVAAP